MPRRPLVALLVETSNTYSRELLHGIRAYLREHGPWSIQLTEQGRGGEPPNWLKNWHGHGIIARIETGEIARAVRATGLPVVNVSASRLAPEFPCVINDSRAIANLAFVHLRERGFRHVGYFGDARFEWARSHETNFEQLAREAGAECSIYPAHRDDAIDVEAEQRKIQQWLAGLSKPVGIMACYDVRGRQLLESCRMSNIPVPDEIAVIGVHNDDLLCDLCDPPLSSVIPNARKSGYEAASLLDRMMRGEAPGAVTVRTPPIGVATRQSTDVIALDDRSVAQAVRFIREHSAEGITVVEVLRHVPMSRTLLEKKFKKLLGRTPHEHILLTRINRVKEQLITTDLPVARIAEQNGFEHTEYLSVAFKRVTGMSPAQFRRQQQR
ncbi:MAG TPA: XylR family transcriptional regulator [Verrucomicrobiales bacterium]|nr:XylR family transcriptional regulator [Verrucomicrobiales bacterium]